MVEPLPSVSRSVETYRRAGELIPGHAGRNSLVDAPANSPTVLVPFSDEARAPVAPRAPDS